MMVPNDNQIRLTVAEPLPELWAVGGLMSSYAVSKGKAIIAGSWSGTIETLADIERQEPGLAALGDQVLGLAEVALGEPVLLEQVAPAASAHVEVDGGSDLVDLLAECRQASLVGGFLHRAPATGASSGQKRPAVRLDDRRRPVGLARGPLDSLRDLYAEQGEIGLLPVGRDRAIGGGDVDGEVEGTPAGIDLLG